MSTDFLNGAETPEWNGLNHCCFDAASCSAGTSFQNGVPLPMKVGATAFTRMCGASRDARPWTSAAIP